MRRFVYPLGLTLLLVAPVAFSQSAATDGDAQFAAGRYDLAATSYQQAFEATRNPAYLKKAGQAYLALGAAGRAGAIVSFRLYAQNADNPQQAAEARALLQQAESLPQPATESTPEVPPPAPPEAPTPAPGVPSVPAAEPTPPLAGLGAAEPPPAVETVGGARWTPGLGFVHPVQSEPAAEAEAAGTGGVSIPAVPDLSLGGGGFQLRVGRTLLNPSNDGVTDDQTTMTMLELGAAIRADFRSVGTLLGFWFDVGGSFMMGERQDPQAPLVMGVQGLRVRGRFGVDLQPHWTLNLGPFIGARADFYRANLTWTDEAPSPGEKLTDNGLESDSGLLFGAHARLHTKESPGDLATFYIDPWITWNRGHQSAVYAGAELGLNPGGLYFTAYYETRMSVSGGFSPEDAPPNTGAPVDPTNYSKLFALSMPIDQRIGLGLTVLF